MAQDCIKHIYSTTARCSTATVLNNPGWLVSSLVRSAGAEFYDQMFFFCFWSMRPSNHTLLCCVAHELRQMWEQYTPMFSLVSKFPRQDFTGKY
jgi:hypothetical protein